MYKLFVTLAVLVAFGNANAQPTAGASALEWAKKKCADLGFKAGTERFGNCVLQLSKNEDAVSVVPKKEVPSVGVPAKSPTQSALKSFKDCDECPEMVVIPEGKFFMGSRDDPFALPIASKDEMPQREVAIQSFSIGKFEVTQGQWFLIMGETPSRFRGRDLPVDKVSWDDVQEFLFKLGMKTGKNYRLPSEAEWEYVARAGSQTAYPFGDELKLSVDFAWSAVNANRQPHQVGEKQPNKFGVHDMQGNVLEWTQDCWNSNYVGAPIDGRPWIAGECTSRVVRGGAWGRTDEMMRSARRFSYPKNARIEEQGFRVVRDN
jgi:formylglycine-generating enzyme required for sulfatase activity